ncbi:MAG: TIGR02710 family CRISPR-associated CARF protein, partial [candidate division WOR-3 bacterium]
MPKAMIVSVGGTPAPIIKSIVEHQPEFVSFLASQETTDQVAFIKTEAARGGVRVKAEITITDDVNDLFHCHGKAETAVQRVLSKGYRGKDVIVDYTGGTKNMSVALALAGITHGFSFSYIGGTERTKEGVGVVVDGKEQVYASINPWDFLALEERKRIALLFNTYQFQACRALIDSLVEKNVRHASAFKKLGRAVHAFHLWDLFRHVEAAESFEKAKMSELAEVDDEALQAFARDCMAASSALDALIAGSDRGRKPSKHLLADLFANAER